tara:strand:- start:54 stop:413 length:360 start_codon:yes stop_codon:yes gene_type:complete
MFFVEDIQNTSDMLNENKYFIGLMMIMVNIGSRFIIEELNDNQRKFINNPYFRRIVIFSVIFMATRDILISFVITGFIVLYLYSCEEDKVESKNSGGMSNVKGQLDKAIDILKVSKDSF